MPNSNKFRIEKRRPDAKPAAAQTQIVLVRTDQVKLALLHATPGEVRRYFLDNPNVRQDRSNAC